MHRLRRSPALWEALWNVSSQFQQALAGPVTQGALFTCSCKSYSAVNVSRTGYEENILLITTLTT